LGVQILRTKVSVCSFPSVAVAVSVEGEDVLPRGSLTDESRGCMKTHRWSLSARMAWSVLLVALWCSRLVSAVEIEDVAPDFLLPSTLGPSVTLSQFKDKHHVLIEFYSLDFNPT